MKRKEEEARVETPNPAFFYLTTLDNEPKIQKGRAKLLMLQAGQNVNNQALVSIIFNLVFE